MIFLFFFSLFLLIHTSVVVVVSSTKLLRVPSFAAIATVTTAQKMITWREREKKKRAC